MSDEQDYQDYLDYQEYEQYQQESEPVAEPEPQGNFFSNGANAIGNAFMGATMDVERSALSGLDYLTDTIGGDNNVFDSVRKQRQQQSQELRNEIPQDSNWSTVRDITQGAIPAIGATIATGNPMIGASVPAAMRGLDKYEEGRDAGKNYLQSSLAGGQTGVSDYFLNRYLELAPLFKNGLSPLKRVATASVGGGLGGGLSEASSVLADVGFLDREVSANEAGKRIGTAGKMGFAGGALTGGVIEGARAVGAKLPMKISEQAEIEAIQQQMDTDGAMPLADLEIENVPAPTRAPTSSEMTPIAPELDTGMVNDTTPTSMMDDAQMLEYLGVKNNVVEPGVPPFLQRPDAGLPSTVDNSDNMTSLSEATLLDAQTPLSEPAPLIQSVSSNARGDDFFGLKKQILGVEEGKSSEVVKPTTQDGAVRKNLSPEETRITESILRTQPDRTQKANASEDAGILGDIQARNTIEAKKDFSPPVIKSVKPQSEFQSPKEVVQSSEYKGNRILTVEEAAPGKPAYRVIVPEDQGYRARDVETQGFADEMRAWNDNPPIPYKGETPLGTPSDKFRNQRGSISNKPADKNITIERGSKDFRDFEKPFDDPWLAPLNIGRKVARKYFRNIQRNAEKYQEARDVYDGLKDKVNVRNSQVVEAQRALDPYFRLGNKDKINKYLEAARRQGAKFQATPENLTKLGLNPSEVQAFMSVRKYFDGALDKFEDAITFRILNRTKRDGTPYDDAKNQGDVQKVKQYIGNLKGKNYVPFGRFGEFYVAVEGADGKLTQYSMFESMGEARNAASKIARKGNKVKVGALETPPDTIYEDLPADMRGFLGFLDADKYKEAAQKGGKKGFGANLVEASLIDGFETDFTRSIARYVNSHAEYIARSKTDHIIDGAIKSARDTKPFLHKELKTYIDQVRKPGGAGAKVWREIQNGLHTFFLSSNPSNLIINSLESLTTAIPQTAHYAKFSAVPGVVGRGAANVPLLLIGKRYPEVLRRINPKLHKAFNEALNNGFLDSGSLDRINRLAERPQGMGMKLIRGAQNALKAPNMFVEDLTKLHTWAMGFELESLPKNKQRIPVTAQDFTYDTKAVGGKTFSNAVGRNAPPLMVFRTYLANYLRLINRSGRDAAKGNVAPLLGHLAGIVGMAGLAGIPGVKNILSVADRNEADWKQVVRKKFSEKESDAIIYGLPGALLNVNFSNTAGLSGALPNTDQGLKNTLASLAFGVLAEPITRVEKFNDYSDKGMDLLAAEQVVPAFARNLIRPYRYATEGVRNNKGQVVLPKEEVTPELLTKTLLGIQDTELAKRYEITDARYKAKSSRNTEAGNVRTRMAMAINNNDVEEIQAIVSDPEQAKYITGSGMKALKQRLKEMNTPTSMSQKGIPKDMRAEDLELLSRYQGVLGK